MEQLYSSQSEQPINKNRNILVISELILLVLMLIGISVFLPYAGKNPRVGVVLGTLAPDSSLSMDATVNRDSVGNYIFPSLSTVDVKLIFTSGGTNKIDSVEAIVHYDPTILRAKAVSFNQELSTQFLTNDALKCNPVYIQKDAAGIETGTIRVARTAIPLPNECPPAVPSADALTSFPSYTPLPINKTGGFALITFETLQNTSTPHLISYELKPFFPSPLEALNDSNATAYVEPALRNGTSSDVLYSVQNLSFIVGQPTLPSDSAPPTVTITSPVNGATVGNSITVTANASDNVGVAKVELSLDGNIICTDTTAPYDCLMNLSAVSSGTTHTIATKAYDTNTPTPNVDTDSITINVCNSDCQAPSAPSSLTVTENLYNQVSLRWNASTDNVGVAGYYVYRKLSTASTYSQIASVATAVLTYTDQSVLASSAYNYLIKAYDAAQNVSIASNSVNVSTPAAPSTTDTTPPSIPSGFTGNAVSTSQINFSWSASTDEGTGVAGYNIYKSLTGSGSFSKINSSIITGTSFGDSGLTASTTYYYNITAVDRANNESSPVKTISVQTQNQTVSTGSISGTVLDQDGSPIYKVKVTTTINGSRASTATDAQGQFIFTNVQPGSYTLKFSLARYTSENQTINVTSGETTPVNIVLTRK